MTKDEALDLALKALERLDGWLALRYGSGLTPQEQQVVTAIKQARSAPVQEPVAFEDWHSANYVQPLEKYGDSYKNMHVRNRWQGWLGAKSTPPAAQPAPVQDLPFGVGGGLVAIKTLLSRDPCVHANTAIEMIDAILKEHPAAQRQWVGLTDEEFEDIELGCRSTSSGKIEAMQKVEAKLKAKNFA
jgi:hypothetical protein